MPIHNDKPDAKPIAPAREGFEEPTISDPMDLSKAGARAPMMAMLVGSASGNLDGGGFSPDGFGAQLDGWANLDGLNNNKFPLPGDTGGLDVL
jgi:hypothetical protein